MKFGKLQIPLVGILVACVVVGAGLGFAISRASLGGGPGGTAGLGDSGDAGGSGGGGGAYPEVVSIDPPPGDKVALAAGHILEVRIRWNQAMSDRVGVSYSGVGAEVKFEEGTGAYLIRIDVGSIETPREYSFTAHFIDRSGRPVDVAWNGTLTGGQLASTGGTGGGTSGAGGTSGMGGTGGTGGTSGASGTGSTGTSPGTSSTGPLAVVSVSPGPGSRVTLPADGLLNVRVEFNRVIPAENIGAGLGGSLIAGDLEGVSDKVEGSVLSFTSRTYPGKEFWFRVSFDDKAGNEVTYYWPGPVRTAPKANTSQSLARSLHLKAWQNLLAAARNDPVARFSVYATRTIAVRHPEICLRADRVFYDTASTTKGFAELYREDPPTWTYDPVTLQNEERRWDNVSARALETGNPLDFRSLSLSRYRVVSRASLLPAGVPEYPIVDHRVGFLPATLRRQGGTLTPLEMAFLRYFVIGPSESNFVVLFADGSAGLWVAGQGLIDAATGECVLSEGGGSPGGALASKPLAIFGELTAWHPLMGRDDTGTDAALGAVVRALGGEAATAEAVKAGLSAEERQLLDDLRATTGLGAADVPYALWAATKTRYRMGAFEAYRKALGAIPYLPTGGATYTTAWYQFHTFGHAFQINSSRLSPLAAWIAAQDFNDPLEKTRAIAGLYYDLNRNGPWTTARTVWGNEWFWYDIEDSVLSRAGTCAIQSGIVAALLDLAGVENYLVSVSGTDGGHEYVYLPQFAKEINNGYLTENAGFLDEYLQPGALNLTALGWQGKFVTFSEEPFPSSLPAAEVERILRAHAQAFGRVEFYGHEQGTWTYSQVLESLGRQGVELLDLCEGN